MRAYVLRRILHSALTLFGVSLVVFGILRVLPGDPAKMLLPEGASNAQVAQLREQLGLEEPLYVQYGVFMKSIALGNFGQSYQFNAPARDVVAERVWPTIHLALAAFTLTVLFGVPAGILAAARHRTIFDYGSIFLAALGQSLPNFWLGIMMILLFGVLLGWLPTSGYESPAYLVLPALTLAAYPTALVARLTRSSMLEVLGKEYVRTARSKGLSERTVVLLHAVKNAAIPVVTVLGLQIGVLLGGAVITESVFAWPGIGKLAVDSIFRRDFPVIQVVLILAAAVFIVINLLVDLTYTVLDPRIRYS
ncbi:MAG: ABC transporter permease [Chloroflexi bacterium]|nr:ABC transporter permease [Chloroflexota bacterium]